MLFSNLEEGLGKAALSLPISSFSVQKFWLKQLGKMKTLRA